MKQLVPVFAIAVGIAIGYMVASAIGAETLAAKIGLPTAA